MRRGYMCTPLSVVVHPLQKGAADTPSANTAGGRCSPPWHHQQCLWAVSNLHWSAPPPPAVSASGRQPLVGTGLPPPLPPTALEPSAAAPSYRCRAPTAAALPPGARIVYASKFCFSGIKLKTQEASVQPMKWSWTESQVCLVPILCRPQFIFRSW